MWDLPRLKRRGSRVERIADLGPTYAACHIRKVVTDVATDEVTDVVTDACTDVVTVERIPHW